MTGRMWTPRQLARRNGLQLFACSTRPVQPCLTGQRGSIDSPPSVHEAIRTVAAVCDLALIPSRPKVDDLDAVGPVVRLLHGVVDYGFVLTQVPAVRRSRDGAEALQRLAERAPVLGRTTFRSDYGRPPGHGSTGFEDGAAARHEVGELYAHNRRVNWQALNGVPRGLWAARKPVQVFNARVFPGRRLSWRGDV